MKMQNEKCKISVSAMADLLKLLTKEYLNFTIYNLNFAFKLFSIGRVV
jgi:hypothetical protein